MNIYEGKLVSQNTKVGIVAARFNEFITSKLLSGAIDRDAYEARRKQG